MARFSEVLTIINGKNQSKVENPNGRYPIYGSGGIMGYADSYLCKANTVIIGRKGSINNPIFVDKPFWNVDTAFGLEANTDVLLPKYLYYFCKAYNFEKLNTTVTIPSLTKANLLNIDIPLPSLMEQKAIVARLDKVDELISLRKKQLQKLDDLVKSRFVEMFGDCRTNPKGWNTVALEEGEYGAQSASAKYDPSRPRYVRITDINDDGTLNDDMVSSSCIEDDIQYSLSYGDFLFARMGATVGKPYAYKSGNQIFAGYLIRYKLNLQRILPEYLFVYTQLEEYKKWVQLNQSGAAQPGINAKKYGSLLIPVAPLEEQKNFRYFVQRVDKSKLTVRQGLDKLELLKQSLMQKYFG